MESQISSKTTTTIVINVINGLPASSVIKKTIKQEIVENGKIKEIKTTVEEFSGDSIDKLLSQFDQLLTNLKDETIKVDENLNEIVTPTATINSLDNQMVEGKTTSKLLTIKTNDGDDQVNCKTNGNQLVIVNDKENSTSDQLIVKPVDSISGEDKLKQLADKSNEQLTDRQQFNQQCLDKHNYYRSLHGVERLTINDKLNELAQDWADHLASIGSLSHRPKNSFGENVYWNSIKDIDDGNKPVDSWYNEINKYNWDKSTFASGTGHFTQIVWKNCKQLGIGKSTGSKGTFVVCNYDPPGNFIGKFAENVLPPIKETQSIDSIKLIVVGKS